MYDKIIEDISKGNWISKWNISAHPISKFVSISQFVSYYFLMHVGQFCVYKIVNS